MEQHFVREVIAQLEDVEEICKSIVAEAAIPHKLYHNPVVLLPIPQMLSHTKVTKCSLVVGSVNSGHHVISDDVVEQVGAERVSNDVRQNQKFWLYFVVMHPAV